MRNIHTYSKLHKTNRPWTDCTKDLGAPHKPNNLGRYAKKAAKALIRPVNTILAVATITVAMSIGEVQGQDRDVLSDTIYGTGMFQTLNIENNDFIGNVSLYLRPESMAMIVPDTTYEFITNNSGGVLFNNPGLPVYIDSTTGIQEFIENSSKAFPNPGSEINIFLPEIEKGKIQYYNTLGQLIKEKEFNSNHAYLALNDISAGAGVWRIITEDNKILSGTYINQNIATNGPASKPSNNSSFKEVQFYEATYWASWVHPDFFTDSTLITLEEGDNGPVNFFMTSNAPPPIDNQDISGIVTNTNTGNPINNALIEIEVVSSGQLYTATSSSDGSFTVNNLPLGEAILFRAGGVSGKYSISDFPNETIEEVINPSDSVNSNFNVSLPNHLPTSTTLAHAKDQNLSGTSQDTIWFYLGNSLTNTQKNTMRNYFLNLQADENNVYTYAEKFEQSNIGINIESGTYNTQAHTEQIITPLGNTLYPVLYANSTMGTSQGYTGFSHEVKRALGFDEVAWYSVMRADGPDFTLEDKDIAREISRMYWNAIYQEEKTWIPMQYLSESMTSNKSDSSNIKDVKARIDELNKAASKK